MTRHHLLLLFMFAILPLPAFAQESAPLPADLYYLDQAGRLWRLPAAGGAREQISPTNQQIIDFALAPGGDWLAYRTQSGLFARALGGAEPAQRLDAEAGAPATHAQGSTLAWSPAGGPMAYATAAGVRVYVPGVEAPITAAGGPVVNLLWSPRGRHLACEADSGAWTIYELRGGALTVAGALEGDSDVAWLPDERLIVTPASGGLQVAALGGEVWPLTGDSAASKPFAWGSTVYYFSHTAPGAPGVLAVRLVGGDAPAEIIGQQAFDTSGARWNAAGSALVVAGDVGLMRVDPATGQARAIPDTAGAVQWAWGPVRQPTNRWVEKMPADLYFLAENAGAAQVWRIGKGEEQAAPLTAEGEDVVAFTASADGKRIAYVAGTWLMAADVGQANARQVAEATSADVAPALRPDGGALAYIAGGVWVTPLDGSAAPALLVGDAGGRVFRRPRWSPTGTWLLVDVAAGDRAEPALLSVTGHGPLTFDADCQTARWTVGNQILCWGAGGLYLVTPGDPAQVEPLLDASWRVVDAVLLPDGAVIFLQRGDAPWPAAVQPMRWERGGTPQPWGEGGLLGAPRLSPDGSMIAGLYNMDEDGRGQLMLIRAETGYRVSPGVPERAWLLAWAGD